MTNFFQILKLAEQQQLPRLVDGTTGIDLHAFKLLRDSHLITAIDASADESDCYLEPSITMAGLDYLHCNQPGSIESTGKVAWFVRNYQWLIATAIALVDTVTANK
jgi:hypothetical protein